MLNSFEIAAGTTAGSKHRRGLLAPNQDAVLAYGTEKLVTAAVSDGCSQSPRSHVASEMQIDWFTQLTHEYAETGKPFDDDAWCGIAEEIAARISWNAARSHLSIDTAIRKMWAATVGGVVLGPEFTHLAFFGDGRFYLNGELIVIKAANEANNQPAYPCYLVSESTIPAEMLRFNVLTFPTAEVQHAAVVTDGLDYYLRAVGKKVPGMEDRIPDPSHFWTADELFAKPEGLDTWLNYIGRDWKKPGNPLVGGRLEDDLAIAVVRRKKTTTEV